MNQNLLGPDHTKELRIIYSNFIKMMMNSFLQGCSRQSFVSTERSNISTKLSCECLGTLDWAFGKLFGSFQVEIISVFSGTLDF